MVTPVEKAYQIIYGHDPSTDLSDWQTAELVLNDFKVPKLGEQLAKECVFQIVNHIEYPNEETTRRIVSRAEAFATELWDDLSDEPHMADIERKEYENIYKPKEN